MWPQDCPGEKETICSVCPIEQVQLGGDIRGCSQEGPESELTAEE